MTDYLTDRTQSVFEEFCLVLFCSVLFCLGGVLSCSQQVTPGVPQGSIILLFFLYVTDLPNSLRAANVLSMLMIPSSIMQPQMQLERVLKTELKFLHDWSTKNELFIYPNYLRA